MTIRTATSDDEPVLRELYEELVAELPELPWPRPAWDALEDGAWLLAEEDGAGVGMLLAWTRDGRIGSIGALYVRPPARRRGVAKALLDEAVTRLRDRGTEWLTVEVAEGDDDARVIFERLGLREYARSYAVTAEQLAGRLRARRREIYGSVHVQTDDRPRVEGAVLRFLPRLGRSERTEVSDPRNGWIAVWDELCSREPEFLRRLARELSDRLGGVTLSLGVEDEVVRYVLFDRGRVMDEYLSVPEYFGPLPPGDVVALSANPTVVARLTGAEPGRVREAARTADSAGELPPPRELYGRIAEVLGLTLPT